MELVLLQIMEPTALARLRRGSSAATGGGAASAALGPAGRPAAEAAALRAWGAAYARAGFGLLSCAAKLAMDGIWAAVSLTAAESGQRGLHPGQGP